MSNAPYVPPEAGIGLDYTDNDVVYITNLTMYCLERISPDNRLMLEYADLLAENGFDNENFDALIGLICVYLRYAGYELSDAPGVEDAIKTVSMWLACADVYDDQEYFETLTPQGQHVIMKGVNAMRDASPGLKRTVETYERQYSNAAPRQVVSSRPIYHSNNEPRTPAPRRSAHIGGYGRPDPHRTRRTRRGGGGGTALPMGTTRSVASNALNRGSVPVHTSNRVLSATDIRSANRYQQNSRGINRDNGAARDLTYGGDNSATDMGTVSRAPARAPVSERPVREVDTNEQPRRQRTRQTNLKDTNPQDVVRRGVDEAATMRQAQIDSLTPVGNEQLHKLPTGKTVLIVEATQANEVGRVNHYCKRTPVTPLDMRGYYILDEKKDIAGFILLDNEDYDMDKTDHETARFFKPWGTKNSLPDPKETSRELAKLQTKAQVNLIERELVEKYGDAETGEVNIPQEDDVLDFDRLHIIDNGNMACVDSNDDLVAIGKRLLLEGVANEDIKQLYREASQDGEIVPVNYHGIHFYNWSLSPESGGDKALELRGLTTHASIRRKLFELSELIPSSTMHLIDKLATDWVNNTMNRRYGYEGEAIDSYMLNIEELLDFLHGEPGDIAKNFNTLATQLVSTVLYPHKMSEDYVRKALQREDEEDNNEVVFASMMSITLINLDSDKFAVNAEVDGGSITMSSWPSMHSAIETIRSTSKPQVSDYYIVTRDNCKMRVSITVDAGVYSLTLA